MHSNILSDFGTHREKGEYFQDDMYSKTLAINPRKFPEKKKDSLKQLLETKDVRIDSNYGLNDVYILVGNSIIARVYLWIHLCTDMDKNPPVVFTIPR